MPRPSKSKRRRKTDLLRTLLALGYRSELEALEEWYERAGLSIRQIAQLINRSYTDVKYRLLSNGFPLRCRGGPNHRNWE